MRWTVVLLCGLAFQTTSAIASASSDAEPASELEAMTQATLVVAGRFRDGARLRTLPVEVVDPSGRTRRAKRFVQGIPFVVGEVLDGREVSGTISVALLGNLTDEGPPVFSAGDLTVPDRRVVLGIEPYPELGRNTYVVTHQKHLAAESDETLSRLRDYLRTVRHANATFRSEKEQVAALEDQRAKGSSEVPTSHAEVERLERELEKPQARSSFGTPQFDEAREATIVGDVDDPSGARGKLPSSLLPPPAPRATAPSAPPRSPNPHELAPASGATDGERRAVRGVFWGVVLVGVTLLAGFLLWLMRRRNRHRRGLRGAA